MRKRTVKKSWVLGIAIFVMGGCGLAYEYTFSKIASDLLGNSVRQWAVVIALMLFCMGVGAEVQRLITQKRALLALLLSQVLLSLLGGFGPILSLIAFAHYPYHFSLIHYGLISMIGVLIGFEIPLITRLNEEFSQDIRSNLATILKMDYIGALVGALGWVFILPKFFTLHETAYVLGGLSLLTALLCWICFRANLLCSKRVLFAILSSAGLLLWGGTHSHKWSIHTEQSLYLDQVIHSVTTPYQHIVLTKGKSGTLRCYINGHIQFSATDEYIYHEHLVHPAMAIAGHKKRVLILGGGDGLAVREVLKYPEVSEIVLVDLDPQMTDLARTHPSLTKLNNYALTNQRVNYIANQAVSPGSAYALETVKQRRLRRRQEITSGPDLHVMNLDASSYIHQAKGRFDVIILDFPDPSSPELAKLYSSAFYSALKLHLAADGIIVQQSTSPFQAKEAFLCIGRTLESSGFAVAPTHDHVPSFGEWGWWFATHKEFLSSEGLTKQLRSITALPQETQYLTVDLIQASTYFGKGTLESTETDITTLLDTAVLSHYTKGWTNE